MAVFFGQGVAFAQTQTEETHAHASSFKWKGINKDDVIDKSQSLVST